MKRLNLVWLAVALTVVLSSALRAALVPITSVDTDLWYHLACGRAFVQLGHLPSHDPFSFTSDQVWIPYEWLYEVAAYGLATIGGITSQLVALAGIVVLNTALLFFLVYRRLTPGPRAAVAAGLSAMLAVEVWKVHFVPRPHLPGYTMLLLFLSALFPFLEGRLRTRWFVLATCAIVVVWVNFHGSYILLPGLLGCVVLGVVGERLLGLPRYGPREVRGAALAVGLGALAALCGPNTWHALPLPLYWIRPNLYTRSLNEYLPPDLLHSNFPWLQMLWLLDAATLVMAVRQRRLLDILMLLPITWLAVFSFRHVLALGCVLFPLAACNLGPLLERVPRLPLLPAAALLAVWSVWTTATDLPRLPYEVRWETFPVDATSFMRDNLQPGRLLNPFEWGGYFMWEIPDQRIFMDGRTNFVYSEQVYRDYLSLMLALPGWEDLLKRYDVEYVVINRQIPEERLGDRLASTAGWHRVYQDEVSRLFVRQDCMGRLKSPPRMPDSQFTDNRRGLDALSRGDLVGATRWLTRAAERDPGYSLDRVELGVVLAQQHDVADARRQWEMALQMDPTILQAHYNLGFSWEQSDKARAMREYRAELQLDPQALQARQRLEALIHGP